MAISNEHRSLTMRANRLLGANLVEQNLVKIEHLEAANERLLELSSGDVPRLITVLGILAYEMKVVREEDILHHLVEDQGIGLVDLRNYDGAEELKKTLDFGACWATWTVPFDQEDNIHFVATAYYLSPAVRTFWEKQFDRKIVWYGTTLEAIADHLEKLETSRTSAGTAAPAPKKH